MCILMNYSDRHNSLGDLKGAEGDLGAFTMISIRRAT